MLELKKLLIIFIFLIGINLPLACFAANTIPITPNQQSQFNDINFAPYMKELQRRIKLNWNPPKGNESRRVVVLMKIAKDGSLLSLSIFKSGGTPEIDRAALNAVTDTAPFAQLPYAFAGNSIDVQFTFDYNVYGNNESQNTTEHYKNTTQTLPNAAKMPHKEFKTYLNQGYSEYLKDYKSPITNSTTKYIQPEPTDKVNSIDKLIKKYGIKGYNEPVVSSPSINDMDEIGEIKISNYSKAIRNLTRTIKLHPDDYRAYYIRGYCNYMQYNYKRAIEDFTQAIELNPNFAMAYSDRGYCKLNLRNYISAIEDYNKAIELKPADYKSYCYRGYSEYKLKDYKNSMNDCTKAIELNPDFNYSYSVKSLNKIREIKSQAKRLYYHSISFYSQTLSITPDNYDMYYLRGILNLEVKEYNDAIHDFSKYIALCPKNYSTYLAYFDKGYAEYQSEKYQEAIDDFTKVIELKPKEYKAYCDRGLSKFRIKDYQGAIEDITKSIKLNRYCAEAFIARASVKSSLKEYESALNDIIEAKKIYLQKMEIKKYKKIIKLLKDIKNIKNPEMICSL